MAREVLRVLRRFRDHHPVLVTTPSRLRVLYIDERLVPALCPARNLAELGEEAGFQLVELRGHHHNSSGEAEVEPVGDGRGGEGLAGTVHSAHGEPRLALMVDDCGQSTLLAYHVGHGVQQLALPYVQLPRLIRVLLESGLAVQHAQVEDVLGEPPWVHLRLLD